MPISAAMMPMKNIIKQSLSLSQASTNDSIAGILTMAMASTVTMGIFPPSPPAPLAPGGAAATNSVMKLSLSLGQAATNSQIAQIMAQAISILVPYVPPSGMSVLKTMIENTVLNLNMGADNEIIATNLAQAIVTYFTCGGVT